ncbi:helix-turn-helix domain-containing protein [Carnobacterium maltaromaticum]|uniref:helix-turn-helix domain-containing protein n=1 Tax=Carnobacterium maltaromaticum TaxID=2751 RepID=UPI00026C8433|nr:helix-turn-helix domain-containing protein [Carnobacterium maltaromaticum]
MDSLARDLLIDNSIKRKITILSMLLESKNPISIGLIATKLNITSKTLQLDIADIIANVPNNIQTTTYNNILSVEKITNNDSGITNYLNELLLDNPLFIIIESIFHGTIKDSFYFAERLYLSESTIKNYLTILKKVLKDYNLTLTYSPIDIVGDEINIRYFYFKYFRYAHPNASQILRNDQYVTMLNVMKSTATEQGIKLNFDYYRLASWLTIVERRIKENKGVHISDEIHFKYSKKDSYLKFKLAIYTHYLSRETPQRIDLSESEIMFAYLTRLDAVIYEAHKSFFTDDFFDQLNKFEPLTIEFLQISNRNLSLNLETGLLFQAYLLNISMLTELTPLFQQIPTKLKNAIEDKHPNIINIWNSILKKHTDFNYNYDIAVNLTLLSETHIRTKRRILFVLTGESTSISYYKELALKCVPYDMEVFFAFNTPLDNTLLEKMNIDLCIYNISPEENLTSSSLYRLSNIPLDSEWDKLLIFLHDM